MADEKPTRRAAPANESEGQRINRELAEAAAEAEERQADEIRVDKPVMLDDGMGGVAEAHGRFIVDDRLVDPMGRPIKG